MHRLLLAFCSALLLTGALSAAPAEFTDWEAARALAAKEGRPLFVEFSGRAWCPPCKALTAEVLTSQEFATWIEQRRAVVLVLDYPRRSERTPEKVAADPALQRLIALRDQHGVQGFPTAVLFDAQGREIGRAAGYSKGEGPAAYLARLEAAHAR